MRPVSKRSPQPFSALHLTIFYALKVRLWLCNFGAKQNLPHDERAQRHLRGHCAAGDRHGADGACWRGNKWVKVARCEALRSKTSRYHARLIV